MLENINSVKESDIQIALFSATVPAWVQDIAIEFMRQDFRVVDLAQNLSNKTAKNVKHFAMKCGRDDRIDAMLKIIAVYCGTRKMIVFTQTKDDANSLMRSVPMDLDLECLHGNIPQSQREVTMMRFKKGHF